MSAIRDLVRGAVIFLAGFGPGCSESQGAAPSGSGGASSGGSAAGGFGGAGASGSGGVGGAAGGATGDAGTGGSNPASSCPKFSMDAPPTGVTLLVPSVDFDLLFVVGIVSGQVYFVDFDKNTLDKIPVSGGAPTMVGPVKATPQLYGTSLLYWMEDSAVSDGGAKYRIVTAPLDDPSNGKVVVDGVDRAEQLIVDGTNAYYESRTPANIFRVPLSGGTPELLVPGGSPLGTLVKDGFLWWLDFETESLERIPVAGGTRERLTEVHFGGPMAGDANGVYWGDTSLKTVEKWTQAGGRVQLSAADPDGVVVTDGIIYWTDGFVNGSVRSIHTDGSQGKSLLCGVETPGGIAVDANYVVVDGQAGIIRINR